MPSGLVSCRQKANCMSPSLHHESFQEVHLLGVSSIYSLLNLVSDPRYKLVIAQKSLIDQWADRIKDQRPEMPIILIGDETSSDEWRRRALRNAVIALTEPHLLEFLASVRPKLRFSTSTEGAGPCRFRQLPIP
jgi:hypothetical protein